MELQSRSCTLCGPGTPKRLKYRERFSTSDLNPEIFSARRSPDKVHFRLMTCTGCGIIYSDPACPTEKLQGLYEDALVNYSGQEQEIYDSYEAVLDKALRLTKGRNVFAEVGGGSGFMLRYGVERGFREQIEVEPSRDACAKFEAPGPDGRFICDLFRPGVLPDNSVSMACFFQVLDHLPDPMAFVRDAHGALEPGGVAVGVVHNTRAISARLLGERSPIFDVEHTYLFNGENARRMFLSAGFEHVEVFPVANRYSARYWMNLVPSPPRLKKHAMQLLQKSRLGDVKIKLHAGNFAVVGRKARNPN